MRDGFVTWGANQKRGRKRSQRTLQSTFKVLVKLCLQLLNRSETSLFIGYRWQRHHLGATGVSFEPYGQEVGFKLHAAAENANYTLVCSSSLSVRVCLVLSICKTMRKKRVNFESKQQQQQQQQLHLHINQFKAGR